MFHLRPRDRRHRVPCTLPCCWPPRPLPKVWVWKDRASGLWRWKIVDPRRAAQVLAQGSTFDHPHAVSNGLYVLTHLTETIVRAR